MRVSYEWLVELAGCQDVAPREVADTLTMAGFNVESLEITDLSRIRIGRVLEQAPHPSSRKPLWVHQVDLGEEVRQIIAGVPNAVPGSLVPVALPGVTVPSGVTVRDGKIAGLEARGMLCSPLELGLSGDHSGILILDRGEPGWSLERLYPLEAILEVDVTPNRPDCLSHLGLARELSAALGRRLAHDFMPAFTGGAEPPGTSLVAIQNEAPDLCSRYIGAVVSRVSVQDSPEWIQRRLRQAGVRPISNVVDVTNYVLLEYGQPLHAFDFDRVSGQRIVVRRAREEESLLCLDGQTRELTPDTLVIADAVRPLAIAGVMGGAESAVGEATSTVLLEAATFDGVNVRATSRRLKLRTEASSRFEKGLSPELALAGARRAAQLLQETGGGQVHIHWPDVYPRPLRPHGVRFAPSEIDAILGTHVPVEEMEAILTRLDFQVSSAEDGLLEALPPVFRLDVSIVPDVAEEVGRIYGYEHVAPRLPGRRRERWTGASPSFERRLDRARRALAAGGFTEAVAPALISGQWLHHLGVDQRSIAVVNPVSDEQDTLRTSLVPSLLHIARHNRSFGRQRVRVFEAARVYLAHPRHPAEQPDEPETLAALETGVAEADVRAALLAMKGLLERACTTLTTEPLEFRQAKGPCFHPGRCASVRLAGDEIGLLGEIHPAIVAETGLEGRALAFEIRTRPLMEVGQDRRFQALPRFPAIERDLAVVVEEKVSAAAIVATATRAGGELLASVGVFDEYRGAQLEAGRKSVALSLVFRSPERTLTDAEADRALEVIKEALSKTEGAGFRA